MDVSLYSIVCVCDDDDDDDNHEKVNDNTSWYVKLIFDIEVFMSRVVTSL